MINVFKQFENGCAFHCCLVYKVVLHQNESKQNGNRDRMLITYIWAPSSSVTSYKHEQLEVTNRFLQGITLNLSSISVWIYQPVYISSLISVEHSALHLLPCTPGQVLLGTVGQLVPFDPGGDFIIQSHDCHLTNEYRNHFLGLG